MRGGGDSLVPKFQKGRGLTRSQFVEGGDFQRDCSFYIKNKLISEMFNVIKSLNLNWEILSKI